MTNVKQVRSDLKLWGKIKSFEYDECGFNHKNMLYVEGPDDKKARLEAKEFIEIMDCRINQLPAHLKSVINTLYVRNWTKPKSAKWLNISVRTFDFWLLKSESELLRFY